MQQQSNERDTCSPLMFDTFAMSLQLVNCQRVMNWDCKAVAMLDVPIGPPPE